MNPKLSPRPTPPASKAAPSKPLKFERWTGSSKLEPWTRSYMHDKNPPEVRNALLRCTTSSNQYIKHPSEVA